jgi:hypothetical protein
MATVKKVKKAQRGACVGSMSGAQRSRYFNPGPSLGQKLKDVFSGGKTKEERQEARAERKAARVEKKAAKAAPEAKSGLKVKKAQAGAKMTKAAQNKRTDDMAKSLDKASVFGKNYIAPSDSVSKARPKGMNFDKKSFDKLPSLDKLKKKIEKKKAGGTVSSQLGSYKNVIGKNTKGKATKAVGLTKANYGKSMMKKGC